MKRSKVLSMSYRPQKVSKRFSIYKYGAAILEYKFNRPFHFMFCRMQCSGKEDHRETGQLAHDRRQIEFSHDIHCIAIFSMIAGCVMVKCNLEIAPTCTIIFILHTNRLLIYMQLKLCCHSKTFLISMTSLQPLY